MTLFECLGCGRVMFPARRLCAACGGGAMRAVACEGGVVEQITKVRQGFGDAGPVILAAVRTRVGVMVIARLDEVMAPGVAVALHETADGAVTGQNEEAIE